MAMELEYIAQQYASVFLETKDRQEAADIIIKRINELTWEKSGEPLDLDTKKQIVTIIGEFLSGKRTWKFKYGGMVPLLEARDNEQFLDLVDYILSGINDGKK